MQSFIKPPSQARRHSVADIIKTHNFFEDAAAEKTNFKRLRATKSCIPKFNSTRRTDQNKEEVVDASNTSISLLSDGNSVASDSNIKASRLSIKSNESEPLINLDPVEFDATYDILYDIKSSPSVIQDEMSHGSPPNLLCRRILMIVMFTVKLLLSLFGLLVIIPEIILNYFVLTSAPSESLQVY